MKGGLIVEGKIGSMKQMDSMMASITMSRPNLTSKKSTATIGGDDLERDDDADDMFAIANEIIDTA